MPGTWLDWIGKTQLRSEAGMYEYLIQPFLSYHANADTKIYSSFVDGRANKEVEKNLLSMLSNIGGNLIFQQEAIKKNNNDQLSGAWASPTLLVVYSTSNYYRASTGDYSRYSFTVYATHKETQQLLHEWLRTNVAEEEESHGQVYVLQRLVDGYKLTSAGKAGLPMLEDNYSPRVVEQVKHLAADIQSKSPCGRLNILHGEPGGGKTHLVRSIIEMAPATMFVLVPPDLITKLGDPDMIGVFLDYFEDEEHMPICFILEDADTILSQRMSDNMPAISAILNTTDGILGSVLDLRVLATTNAAKVDIDAALLRPGRLCTRIHIGRLSNEQAQRVLDRLCKGAQLPEASPASGSDVGYRLPVANNKHGEYTLAEIYKAAYDYTKNIRTSDED